MRAEDTAPLVAGFPAIKTLEGSDFTFATGAPPKQFLEFASRALVKRAENVDCRHRPASARRISRSRSGHLTMPQVTKVRLTLAAEPALTLEAPRR